MGLLITLSLSLSVYFDFVRSAPDGSDKNSVYLIRFLTQGLYDLSHNNESIYDVACSLTASFVGECVHLNPIIWNSKSFRYSSTPV